MATIKSLFSGQTALTITLTSLANAASRSSLVVDNTTNLYIDALLTFKSKSATGTIASDKAIYVYGYGSLDGSAYPDTVLGTDATITLNSPTQLRLVGVLNVPVSNTAYTSGPWSVAAAFGGVLPPRWGIVATNSTGLALSATAGDHVVNFVGVSGQSV